MQTATRYISKQCNVKDQLLQLGELLEPHHYNDRKELLDEMIASCAAGREHNSEKMLGWLMAGNLRKRFSGTGITENLYESVDGVSQIRLFDILIHQFPFVKYSQEMANNAILSVLQQQEEVCIIDIGIGLGTQMGQILEKAKALTNLRKLTIVGIEPFENALRTAGGNILQYKEQLSFDLEFVPVPQYIEETDLSQYRSANTPCIVNASLALHHIKSDADRNRVIAGIRALQPVAFLLIEPSVNHFTDDLAARMINTYEHFIRVFRMIDRLDISRQDKTGLKLFFGRELEDILSKDEDDRFEKHEPVAAWLQRLQQNGFRLDTTSLLNEPKEVLGVKIRNSSKGYTGIIEGEETMLAVMFAS